MSSYSKLVLELANPATTIVCAGFLYYSQRNIKAQIKRVKNDLESQIDGVKKDLNEAKIDLAKGINQAQTIAAGAPLVVLNDPKKLGIMEERLKAFAARVRGGGGDNYVKESLGDRVA
ncbi:hypothetical protein HOY80DRAFT_1035333 [Tuber brumale]|nr:hypothetical protein HOY80DRAFT_1035333 [Tuber brumale]